VPTPNRSHALDHVVVALFEQPSMDNVLGHLNGPENGKTFQGMIGTDLSNPIPAWAEHGAARKVVSYTVATDMDGPHPDSGEECYHTNTRLFNTLDERNRFKTGAAVTAHRNAPPEGTAAASSGLVVNSPAKKCFSANDAETIFERLEAHGTTWKVYVMEPMALSFSGLINCPQLKGRLATHFARLAEFEQDAAAGTLPPFAFIEPKMISGHGDYHPAFGRSFSDQVNIVTDPPSSTLAGETVLKRVSTAYRSATSETGANIGNTALLIGWDEPGGAYDHVPPDYAPPGQVPPPDPTAPAGERDFAFERSGRWVPAIIVSPWVASGSVYHEEYRHTSLIVPLRKTWGIDAVFSRRDAAARTFDHVFSLDTSRDVETWVTVKARPVPAWTMDSAVVGKALRGLSAKAIEMRVKLPPDLDAPDAQLPPDLVIPLPRNIAHQFFPLLVGDELGAYERSVT
jgi:phospholipase C